MQQMPHFRDIFRERPSNVTAVYQKKKKFLAVAGSFCTDYCMEWCHPISTMCCSEGGAKWREDEVIYRWRRARRGSAGDLYSALFHSSRSFFGPSFEPSSLHTWWGGGGVCGRMCGGGAGGVAWVL